MATINAIGSDNPIEVTKGGTGLSAPTDHSVLVGSGPADITPIVVGVTNQVLLGNTAADPSWGQVNLTTAVTGVLPIGNGGVTDTGFATWDGGAPYYSDAVLGDFTISQSGTGYINGTPVSWTAPQTVAGLVSGVAYYIYVDSAGTIGKDTTYSLALFQNNIVLFEVLRDATAVTNNQITVKENHLYNFPVSVLYYNHNIIGTVIENVARGANITLNGTVKIEIVGADVLTDHGLDTVIPNSGGTAETFNQMFTDGTGKWATHATSDTFTAVYNNAGTVQALGANKYGVYVLYASKDDLNSALPVYFAVINTTQYNNLGQAQTAISNGTVAIATGELNELELCQLGYVIFGESSGIIEDVIVAKATLRSTISISTTNVASLITVNTTNFDGILSALDTNVQVALETIDDWGKTTNDHAVLIGNGTGSAIGSLAVAGNGELIIGSVGADPVVAAITAGAGISVANAAGSITISSTGGLVWTVITTATQAMAVNNGYIANRGAGVVFTLPTTAAVGERVRVTGILGIWSIAQNVGETIYFGSDATTTGVTGSLTTTIVRGAVELVCVVADTDWQVLSGVGNVILA